MFLVLINHGLLHKEGWIKDTKWGFLIDGNLSKLTTNDSGKMVFKDGTQAYGYYIHLTKEQAELLDGITYHWSYETFFLNIDDYYIALGGFSKELFKTMLDNGEFYIFYSTQDDIATKDDNMEVGGYMNLDDNIDLDGYICLKACELNITDG